ANDIFGADGKGNSGVGLVSITINDVTYSYDKATDQITSGGKVVDNDAVLTVTTALHGTLELNFATGAFQYVAPNIDGNATEKFAYVIVDGDGDVSTSTLTVNITDTGASLSARSAALSTDGGAEPAGRSEALSAQSSGEAEAGPHRLHGGGGALSRPALDARDVFADRELDLSRLGHHRGAESQSHAPPSHDLHALGDRHMVDAAPPPAATVSTADVHFHHTGG
ncbi:MAG TPA: hypothetical protein VFE11_09545, partial [Dongiaceae bacterium]|nr:hypothetical protein [Dongiaceae bacterium]